MVYANMALGNWGWSVIQKLYIQVFIIGWANMLS